MGNIGAGMNDKKEVGGGVIIYVKTKWKYKYYTWRPLDYVTGDQSGRTDIVIVIIVATALAGTLLMSWSGVIFRKWESILLKKRYWDLREVWSSRGRFAAEDAFLTLALCWVTAVLYWRMAWHLSLASSIALVRGLPSSKARYLTIEFFCLAVRGRGALALGGGGPGRGSGKSSSESSFSSSSWSSSSPCSSSLSSSTSRSSPSFERPPEWIGGWYSWGVRGLWLGGVVRSSSGGAVKKKDDI